jgi:hypothetical protein
MKTLTIFCEKLRRLLTDTEPAPVKGTVLRFTQSNKDG